MCEKIAEIVVQLLYKDLLPDNQLKWQSVMC